MFGFPDIDTNDEHVRPNAARAYRARMEFLGTSLLCIEHGSGGNRFAWYFNERWDSQMIQTLTVLEQSESKLRLVICLKKAPTPLWQEYRSLREIGRLCMDQNESRDQSREKSVPSHTRPRTCHHRIRHSQHRNGRMPIQLIARSLKSLR